MGAKGLRWSDVLESAPESWKRVPLGEVFEERKEQNHPDLPLLSVTAEHGVVPRDSLTRRDTSNPDKSRYLRVCPGDIVYNTMRMWQGVSALASEEGIVSPAYTVCTPRPSIDATFASYLLKVQALVNVFRNRSQGLVDDTLSLRFDEFAKIRIPLPPLAEQKRIAEIIGSVDETIQATRAVIEQTHKVKQGMLHELLTRGIGHTRFKQTEIGEFPEGWEVRRLGDLIPKDAIRNGLYKPSSDYGEGAPIVRIDAFQNGDAIGAAGLKRVRITSDEVAAFGVQKGDVLINRVNSLSHLGKVGIVGELGEPTVFESNMMCIRLPRDAGLLPEYLLYLLASERGRSLVRRSAKQAIAQASINQGDVEGFAFAIPPVGEQRTIVKGLAAANDAMVNQEYRLRQLISVKRSSMAELLSASSRVVGTK